jgi:hypothetical protein
MASSLTLGISAAASESPQQAQLRSLPETPIDLCETLQSMDRFAIINNRKRAIIALVHSVFFLGVAAVQLTVSHAAPFSTRGEKAVAGLILLTIYMIVTAALLILLRLSGCVKERLYFAFCAASAAFGLVRILLGDPVLHANILRVLLLLCAVIIGTGILRTHFAGDASSATEC